MLFIVYTDDLVDVFGHILNAKIFVDDVKNYVSIGGIDSVNILQDSLAALAKWASDWQLKIAIGKCVALHLGKNNWMHNYVMNDAVLPNVRETRDLGFRLLLTANYVSRCTLPRSPLKPINMPVLVYGASNRVTRIFYLEHFVYMLGPH